MSEYEFKVGDRVRVVADDVRPQVNGRCGVVLSVEPPASGEDYPFEILLDGPPPAGGVFGPHEIEPETPDEPDMVEHPNHYSAGTPDGVEVIDILRAHEAAGGTWETMNALKYILRFPFKGNAAQDLAKAERYLGMWRDRQVSA